MIEIIPAIDLKNHEVVRLSQGRMDDSITYHSSPVKMAEKWVKAGAARLHLVDLNGAFDGKPFHHKEIKEILRAFPTLQIEVGGGIRSLETLEFYFQMGVSLAILGTIAIQKPDFIFEACAQFPQKIILGVDAKNGKVATHGWGQLTGQSAIDFAKKFQDCPIESIIYTDIAKDGMLAGMNFQETRNMATAQKFPIIASGGLTSLTDIDELKKIPNIKGVIAGKALYEGRIDLCEAIKKAC